MAAAPAGERPVIFNPMPLSAVIDIAVSHGEKVPAQSTSFFPTMPAPSGLRHEIASMKYPEWSSPVRGLSMTSP